ncbi:MAG: hypothetical protein ACRC5A_07270 [Enterobacteriaceae bacterium]
MVKALLVAQAGAGFDGSGVADMAAFDFEINASDDASAALARLEYIVDSIDAPIRKAARAMDDFSGKKSLASLDGMVDRFGEMNLEGKDFFRHLTSLVPPLKTIKGLSSGAKFGPVGAAIAGGVALSSGLFRAGLDLNEKSKKLDDTGTRSSRNPEDEYRSQRLYKMAGLDENTGVSIRQKYREILRGQDEAFISAISAIGLSSEKFKELLKNDDSVDEIGLIDLLRNTLKGKTKMQKDEFLQLTGFDMIYDPVMMDDDRWKLLKSRATGIPIPITGGDVAVGLRSDDDVAYLGQAVGGKWDQITSWVSKQIGISSRLLGNQLMGNQKEELEKALSDEAFLATLPKERQERYRRRDLMPMGRAEDRTTSILDEWYSWQYDQAEERGNREAKEQIELNKRRQEIQPQQMTHPSLPGSTQVDSSARSVRNNNPWNLNYKEQRGARLEGGYNPRFAMFSSLEDGVLAAERQLMLYYSGQSAAANNQPLQTVNDIISLASPPQDRNNTGQMIRKVSDSLGVNPHDQLDLSDPELRARLLTALFNQEGNNPLSSGQVLNIIYQPTGERRERAEQQPQQAVAQSEPAPVRAEAEEREPLPINPPQQQVRVDLSSISSQLSDAIRQGLNEGKIQIELTMVDRNGRRKIPNTRPGVKIVTAMADA